MKLIKTQFARFSRFELTLGKDCRIYYLETIETDDILKVYLIDYCGWPVTDFHLIEEAKRKFHQFNSKGDLETKMRISL